MENERLEWLQERYEELDNIIDKVENATLEISGDYGNDDFKADLECTLKCLKKELKECEMEIVAIEDEQDKLEQADVNKYLGGIF